MHSAASSHKSFADRLDPGGRFRRQATTLAALGRFPFRQLLHLLGVDPQSLDEMRRLHGIYDRMADELERCAAALGPLGWIVHGLAHAEAYSSAASLLEHGQAGAAEDLLVRTYNDNNFAFIRFYHRVMSLYQEGDRWNAIRLERLRILDEAYQAHTEGRYASAIMLVLSQIDGIFIDRTGKPVASFFDPKKAPLVDTETLAGHPAGLRQLSGLMSEEQRSTAIAQKLNRHGIMHGRLLGYDTLRNSTKAWAALLAVIEAVGPGSRWHREEP